MYVPTKHNLLRNASVALLVVALVSVQAQRAKKKQSKKATEQTQADDVECVFVMSLLSRIHADLGDFNAALPLAREVLANRR